MSEPTYRPATGAGREELARFLSAHQWPFHARARLSCWEGRTTTPVDWDGD
jgi:hypothetical protein